MQQLCIVHYLPYPVACTALARPNPSPLTPDPAGEKNVGNQAGKQFITGACLSDADCASGCCAVLNGGGICSGPAVSTAQGKGGCGFNGAGGSAPPSNSTPPSNSAPSAPANTDQASPNTGSVDTAAPGSQNVGKGNAQQFITGQCFTDADCASTCCAGRQGSSTGACSAVLVANSNGKTGCGFVQA